MKFYIDAVSSTGRTFRNGRPFSVPLYRGEYRFIVSGHYQREYIGQTLEIGNSVKIFPIRRQRQIIERSLR
ncbi:MAG: hypothetical protein K2N80_03605, partial [Lachnospiraceae bacterium]|nr:hypothetical protein [Lachnospiraceae bacterium]